VSCEVEESHPVEDLDPHEERSESSESSDLVFGNVVFVVLLIHIVVQSHHEKDVDERREDIQTIPRVFDVVDDSTSPQTLGFRFQIVNESQRNAYGENEKNDPVLSVVVNKLWVLYEIVNLVKHYNSPVRAHSDEADQVKYVWREHSVGNKRLVFVPNQVDKHSDGLLDEQLRLGFVSKQVYHALNIFPSEYPVEVDGLDSDPLHDGVFVDFRVHFPSSQVLFGLHTLLQSFHELLSLYLLHFLLEFCKINVLPNFVNDNLRGDYRSVTRKDHLFHS